MTVNRLGFSLDGSLLDVRRAWAPALVLLSCLACSDAGGDGGSADDGTDPTTPDSAVQAQLEAGRAAYGDYCPTCHGALGTGTGYGPAIIGDTALPLEAPPTRMLRTTEFRTALDVYLFVRETMPWGEGMSLDDATYLDIVAFNISENGVELTEPLTEANAGSVVIHP